MIYVCIKLFLFLKSVCYVIVVLGNSILNVVTSIRLPLLPKSNLYCNTAVF